MHGGIPEDADRIMTAALVQYVPLILILGIFYFVWYRPRHRPRESGRESPRRSKQTPWVPIATFGGAPGQVTRLLCASAFLSSFLGLPTFHEKFIRFYENRIRATTPELGFDARLVLLACQIARRRAQRYIFVFAGVALLTLVLAFGTGPGAIVAGLVLSWLVHYFKLLRERTTLIGPFRHDAFDAATVTRSFANEPLDEKLAEALPSEHQNLLVYATFLPFVGAGIDWGGWSFSTFLDKAKPDAGKQATIPFSIEELYAAVEKGIASLNIPLVRSEDWYFANGADLRGNKDILYDVEARPSQHLSPELAAELSPNFGDSLKDQAAAWA
jgi:hypothetical protein